jgi:plasmid stabilization system protein ParE
MSRSEIVFDGSCSPDLPMVASSGGNPDVARRVARTIYDGCAGLQKFPNMGRPSNRMNGRRKPGIPSLALHRCVYRVTEQAVEISRIFHGAQDWP